MKLFFHLLDLPFLPVSSFLHLVVHNYQIDSGEESSTSSRKNAFASDQATQEAGPILEPVHVRSAENKRTKFKCPECGLMC